MYDQDRNIRKFAEVDIIKQTIQKANSVDILCIFKKYGLTLDQFNKQCQCPFLFHQNGQERSASFNYYPNTNSFYCFGCKSGGAAAEFVSLYENISKYKAALSILENNFDSEIIIQKQNSDDYKISLEFSHLIREFMKNNLENKNAILYAESLCAIFDSLTKKYVLDNNGYKKLYIKLKYRLENFNNEK